MYLPRYLSSKAEIHSKLWDMNMPCMKRLVKTHFHIIQIWDRASKEQHRRLIPVKMYS